MPHLFLTILIISFSNLPLHAAQPTEGSTKESINQNETPAIPTPEELLRQAQANIQQFLNTHDLKEQVYKQFREAAETQDPESMFRYGVLLKNTTDPKSGIEWIKKAADANYDQAIEFLAPKEASMKTGAIALSQNNNEAAIKIFTELADKGDPDAQFMLGMIYNKNGDRQTANIWYEKAAAANHPIAQTVLDLTIEPK